MKSDYFRSNDSPFSPSATNLTFNDLMKTIAGDNISDQKIIDIQYSWISPNQYSSITFEGEPKNLFIA